MAGWRERERGGGGLKNIITVPVLKKGIKDRRLKKKETKFTTTKNHVEPRAVQEIAAGT